jgi:hypothetical protein
MKIIKFHDDCTQAFALKGVGYTRVIGECKECGKPIDLHNDRWHSIEVDNA